LLDPQSAHVHQSSQHLSAAHRRPPMARGKVPLMQAWIRPRAVRSHRDLTVKMLFHWVGSHDLRSWFQIAHHLAVEEACAAVECRISQEEVMSSMQKLVLVGQHHPQRTWGQSLR